MIDAPKILIADDEPDILEILAFNLQQAGFAVSTAKNGVEAIEKAKQIHPDLIILDVMMPYKTGIEVCTLLRQQDAFKSTLIIFLTALTGDTNEIIGLETGADDYLTKPISPKVLITKVNALLRRKAGTQNNTKNSQIDLGVLKIDKAAYLIYKNEQPIQMPKKEFELLALLASQPGRVFLRNEILDKVWGADVVVGDRTIDVHVRKIRQKLNMDCITTVKGVGYKFEV
jgi:two-component system, OmpR family, alkaline phosphatase synthesis response regulator PhoP